MDHRSNHNEIVKKFLLIVVPIALFLGILSIYMYKSEVKIDHHNLFSLEMQLLYQQKNEIQSTYESIVSDLLFLSTHHELQHYITDIDKCNILDLNDDLVQISAIKGSYDQIRFIDGNGMEAIRVNYNDGDPEIVEEENLQDKGGRYYFTDSIVLEKGEIFISPLDLNIEHGEIEIPHKPMIRFGTPVFDGSGTKKGVLFINYHAGKMLESIRNIMSYSEGIPMLLNPEGYWLVSPAPEDEWGFMHDNNKTFANRYPDMWKEISTGEAGHIITHEGLFSYITIAPLKEGWISSTGATKAHQASEHELSSTDYKWKAVLHIPAEEFFALSQRLAVIISFAFLIAIIIIGVLVWRFVRASYEREFAADNLVRSNRELKELEDIITVSPGVAFLWRNEEGWPVEFVSENVKQFGYSPDELRSGSVPFLDMVHPDDLVRVGQEVSDYSKSGVKEFTQEYRLVTKDGRVAWVDDRTFIRRDTDGNITHYQGIMLDITEKKQAEEVLKQYEKIVSSSKDLLAFVDRNFIYRSINGPYLKAFDRSRAEIINHSVREVVGEENYDNNVKNHLKKCLKGDEVHFQAWYSTPSAGKRFWEVSYYPYFEPDNTVSGIVIGVHDTTERKLMEEALRTENIKLIEARKIASLGSWEYDMAKDKLHWSEEAYEIFGVDRDEGLEVSLKDLMGAVHPDDRDFVRNSYEDSVLNRVPYNITHRVLTRDGTVKHVNEICVTEYGEDGTPFRSIGTVLDITELKLAEEEIKEYARMQSVLIKEINHRVKNNLFAILGMINAEKERTGDEGMELISRLAGRVLGLSAVHDMLSRSEWRPVALEDLCMGILKGVFAGLPGVVGVDYTVSPSDINVANTQAHQLAMLINELATNSVKHRTDENKTLQINIDIKDKGDDLVYIYYKDNGPGYPEGIIEGDFPDTSIGLDVMMNIAKRSLKGKIDLSNHSGGGAVCELEFVLQAK